MIGSLFPLGRVLITANAKDALDGTDVLSGLEQHAQGKWGDLSEDDRIENERSLNEGFRLLSAYEDRNGTRYWIITEADRSATTVLLPEDY